MSSVKREAMVLSQCMHHSSHLHVAYDTDGAACNENADCVSDAIKAARLRASCIAGKPMCALSVCLQTHKKNQEAAAKAAKAKK